jgi:hypothetical protein
MKDYTHEEIMRQQHDFLDYVEKLQQRDELADRIIPRLTELLRYFKKSRDTHYLRLRDMQVLPEAQKPATRPEMNATATVYWKPTTQPPAKGIMVWAVYRKTRNVYMHVYGGDKDLEWENFEAYIEAPIYKPIKAQQS